MLWDIDGTLLSSGGAVARTFLDAVEAICGVRPSPVGLDFGGRLDPEIAAMLVSAVAGRPEQVADVLAHFESLVASRQDALREHVRLLPGVLDLVSELAAADVVQTVVTGNLETVGRFKLDAADLVPPIDLSLGGFGASGVDRTAVAQIALDRLAAAGWRGSPDTCWVVGDTPRDLACARALGLRCALVATGRHTAEALSALGADLVLSGLTEAATLRAAWFS
ncbi:MAG: family hydrolase [Frankiales bacterium]|nr:family hydrolase [Frankiales bacterium]